MTTIPTPSMDADFYLVHYGMELPLWQQEAFAVGEALGRRRWR